MVEALRYKPEGHGFDSRGSFSDLILPAPLSTQPLTEMSIRDMSWGEVKAADA